MNIQSERIDHAIWSGWLKRSNGETIPLEKAILPLDEVRSFL
jgi:hypothetical protein